MKFLKIVLDARFLVKFCEAKLKSCLELFVK